MVDMEYLKKSPLQKFWYNFLSFFKNIPAVLVAFFKAIPARLLKYWNKILDVFDTIRSAAKSGEWKTRSSFLVMGFGQFARKQWLRGLLYLLFEVLFILYMVFFGWKYLAKMGTLGEVAMIKIEILEPPFFKYKFVDNSMLILL